jgi:hypothetical protein
VSAALLALLPLLVMGLASFLLFPWVWPLRRLWVLAVPRSVVFFLSPPCSAFYARTHRELSRGLGHASPKFPMTPLTHLPI